MSINNLGKIKTLLSFNSEDDFYHLQIIKRKKEHPGLGSNSMVIKTYYIKSIEHLEKVISEIICICNFHNARGCINLNKRNFEKIAFHTLRKITDQIMNKDFSSVKDAYNSVCGIYSNESEKKWIIDVDRKDNYSHGLWIATKLVNLEPNSGIEKVICILDTKNGYHLITKPFNISESKPFLTEEIHKDNHTILYIP